jgi:hypothetical protein
LTPLPAVPVLIINPLFAIPYPLKLVNNIIYISISVIQIYENGSFKATYASSLTDGATYKVQRTGNTITYLSKSSATVGFVLII